jgi:sulfatase maturation enzyme AslB (radical SAM superfamily)
MGRMALIRVTSCKGEDTSSQQDVILNTAHVVMVHADEHKPPRGVWVQFVGGEPVLVCLTFEEMWALIQRET